MTSNWTTLSASNLAQVMNPNILAALNAANASAALLTVVREVRASIAAANRVPLSKTVDSIPPEGVRHVLTLTVQALGTAEPQLAQYCESWSFKRQADAAQDWMEKAARGEVSYPSDPDQMQLPTGIRWGDNFGSQGVTAVSIYAGGTGYVVGDKLSASGGNGYAVAQFVAIAVDSVTGALTGVCISWPGNYVTWPPLQNPITGGSGTGAVLCLTISNVQGPTPDMSTDGPYYSEQK